MHEFYLNTLNKELRIENLFLLKKILHIILNELRANCY